jgi:hypothetical protein
MIKIIVLDIFSGYSSIDAFTPLTHPENYHEKTTHTRPNRFIRNK